MAGLPSTRPTRPNSTPLSVPSNEALSPEVEQLARAWNIPLSRADFETLFTGALPGALPVFSVTKGEGDKLSYKCNWLNDQGQEMAHLCANLSQKPNGSLTLEWGATWCHRDYRGQGFLENMAVGQMDLLQKLSSHPLDTLEMGAGGDRPAGSSQSNEVVGRYLWARLGIFEFAGESRDKTHKAFESFLSRLAQSRSDLPPALLEQLRETSREWTRPQQFAEIDPPFVSFPIARADGRVVSGSLGMAFLLDSQTPNWSGTCNPNQLSPQQYRRVKRLLQSTSGSQQALPSPQASRVQAALRAQVNSPEGSIRQRWTALESLASLTGKVDIELALTLPTGAPPELLDSHLRRLVDQGQTEPAGLLSKAVGDSIAETERVYAKKLSAALGRPAEKAEFRSFYLRCDGDYKKMDRELANFRPC